MKGHLGGLLLLLALCPAAPLTAQDGDDEAELAALLETLEQETAIVTRTRMNRDFVPGMVTVVEGETLRRMGVRTVWDALAQVPGVQAEIDLRGNPTATARGVYFPFNSGSIQILLNGLPIGREDIGSNGATLTLPIAHVERLEFVRGPGSVLHGDFAFQGLLNIVTRQKGQFVELAADNHGIRGGHLLHAEESGDWRYSASLARLNSDEVVLPAGRRASEQRGSAILQLHGRGLSLLAQGQQREIGRHLAPSTDPGFRDRAWTLAAAYEAAPSPLLHWRVHGQWLSNRVFSGELRTPQGVGSLVFEGSQLRGGAELRYAGWQRQQWLLGAEWLAGDIDLATFRALPAGPGQPPRLLRIEDEKRRVNSVFLQNQIELHAQLHLTLGLRYDDNGDIGTRLTPRASMVWQPADRHVLKLQYAEGHRSPTFFELFGDGRANPSLDFEVNATSEMSYIHRKPGRTLRATLFRARLDDMIFVQPGRADFANVAKARTQGIELEWEQRLVESLRLQANLAHTHAEDNRNLPRALVRIPSAPRRLGHLGLLWEPRAAHSYGLSWTHVGKRPGSSIGDGAYDRIDLSASFRGWLHPALDLRLGIENVLDARTVQIGTNPLGINTFDFRDRIAWAELRWNW